MVIPVWAKKKAVKFIKHGTKHGYFPRDNWDAIYKGYRLHQYLSKQKKSGTSSAKSGTSSRRSSMSISSSGSGVSTRGTRLPSRRKLKRKRGVVMKSRKSKVKKEHITKKFRKKVRTALEEDKPKGWYRNIITDRYYVPIDNQQTVVPLGFSQQSTPGFYFGVDRMVDAASALWNGYTSLASPNRFASGQFGLETFKMRVIDSWVNCYLVNNSQRVYILKVLEIKPKYRAPYVNFLTEWTNGLANEVSAPAVNNTSINISSVTPQILHEMPEACFGLMERFDVNVTRYVMEPGQSMQLKLQGPSEFDFDMNKYNSNGVVQDMQKFSRQWFVILQNDLIGTTSPANAPARWKDPNTAADQGYGLLAETREYYKFELPEEVGTLFQTTPTGPTFRPRNLAHFAKYFGEFRTAPSSGAVRLDEENPISVIPDPK